MKPTPHELPARANPVAKYLKQRCTGGSGRHEQSFKAQRQQNRAQLRKEFR